MSITRELRKWVESHTTNSLFLSYPPQHEVRGTAESLKAVADEIDAEHKRLTDKAHADGERSAMKQVRSRSVDYRKGYEQAMKDVEERTKTEQGGSQTIDILMELLNEYYESGCAIEEDRVTYYADRLDGRTEDKRVDERTKTEQNGVGSSKALVGSSITDELRIFIAEQCSYLRGAGCSGYNKMLEIADRIDERYAEGVQLAWADGIARAEGDLKAFEATHVKLPLDADGVPIRLGDEMELTDEAANRFDGNKHFGKVEELSVLTDGWFVDGEPSTDLRHVRPDTWERIIGDALTVGWANDSWNEVASAEIHDRLVERCRKLAGDAE